MAGDSGYTTLTHYIDIEVFLNWIQGDIKNVIRTHGHKNCGLVYEDVCEKIKKIIFQKKQQMLRHMDEPGKEKFNSEWDSQRNGFLNKLFEGEGFKNLCFPKESLKYSSDLRKLIQKFINFCGEKEDRRTNAEGNNKYSECIAYNRWIDTERRSFQR
ncbi:surface-associated interspersed protein 8.2 (SURFIN 8.2) (SURF8.2) [Plasmodium ovale wallikeri]|uniref:Surface-associated interspersed protein 8.2 (SURFIN 8.2) (SURF8.2) n=1 Tax=Plasmodium ovale wallikeri TaxID=864142 RepID=A0A1A9AGL5_PLAOA|nr:surface-associated interspersed protein 8.2 (SURFIN 8.2) (SURF8.2) [Plasmodium ovale wallikeri]